ncbi:viral aspartic protease [Phaeovulum sp. W22_SRMD_FR3]|uniref:viral aspartic protease n=1 Tax=Phaeovulum sp. W22_SRMD_FR3 TaxID=3240274 RepID=UPI003F9CD566
MRPSLSGAGLWIALGLLAGCGGGGGPANLPDGKDIETTKPIESYTTNHNGYSRVRLDKSTSADAGVIAQFEDSNPADPAGYRNLIALSDAAYAGKMTIEVLAQVAGSGSGEKVTRLLRLTADQNPFENVSGGALVTADGTFHFRGQNFVWVGIDGNPLLSGSDSNGLVDMVLDFGAETASINLRTGVSGASDVRTEISAENLPFNIRTGAYGGDITVQVWDPNSNAIFGADGSLRGNVGGSPTYADNHHGMTTSGLYTATGTGGGSAISVDGVFFGTDPNVLP